MTTHDFSKGPLSQAELDAVLEQARIERAKAMRRMLSAAPRLIKRLAGKLRPSHQHLPQAGSWTLRTNRA